MDSSIRDIKRNYESAFEQPLEYEENIKKLKIDEAGRNSLALRNYETTSITQQFNTLKSLTKEVKETECKVAGIFDDIKLIKKTALPAYAYEATFERERVISQVHANFVSLAGFNSICAQAPGIKQIEGFWEAVIKYGSLIVDLRRPSEIKWHYHPIEGMLHLTTREIGLQRKEKITEDFTKDTYIELIQKKGEIGEYIEKGEIIRLHYTAWPDCGAVNTETLKFLVDTVMKEANGLPLIHCRGGVGRSGTLIVCLALQNLYNNQTLHVDTYRTVIDSLILTGREERGAFFVQDSSQYESIVLFAKELLGV